VITVVVNQGRGGEPWRKAEHQSNGRHQLRHNDPAGYGCGVRHALHPQLQAKAGHVRRSCDSLRQKAGCQDQPTGQQDPIRHRYAPLQLVASGNQPARQCTRSEAGRLKHW
jgi:hypothetical protein